ncbi:MAG: MFS transporter [Proteobacteria bacterium]|nr:MFS transporter [Pseudomonadota bacterium]
MTDAQPTSSARTFALAGCLVFATQLGIALDLPSLATIARELGASQRMVELSVSAYVVGVAAPILVWGVAADRFGRRATLNAALVLFIAASLLLAFADRPETFVALRFVQGVGGGGCSILGRIVVRDAWNGEALARRVAVLSVSFIVAIGGGQFVGALLEQYGAWRMGFVLLAALACVSAIVSRLVTIGTGRSTRPLGEMFGTYVGLMKERQFLFPTLAGGFSYAALRPSSRRARSCSKAISRRLRPNWEISGC